MKDIELVSVEDSDWFGRGMMDISYDGSGNVNVVQGLSFLNQGVQKDILVNRIDTNLYQQYGATIRAVLGGKFDSSLVRSYILQSVVETLQRYVNLQTYFSELYTYTDEELLDSIQSMVVEQDTVDVTKYNITIQLKTKAGDAPTPIVVQI